VRCERCFALHFMGSRFCARCGRELSPEPVLETVDAPCPRCARALSVATGGVPGLASDAHTGLLECTGCGGLFVQKRALERILAEAGREHGLPQDAPPPSTADTVEPVQYVKCPFCKALMNHVNFARRSGVVVDVCKEHGTWFDAGELTAIVEFAASGGLAELLK
jgi:Zn-finger nucleic acid-binding protein